MSTPTLLQRVNPVYWFMRLERAIWALFAEVEYRLKIVPRGTPLAPRPFDRRLLRTVLIVLPTLVASLFIQPPLRTRLLLLLFVLVILVVGVIFLIDAREGMTAPPSPGVRGNARPPVRSGPAGTPAGSGVASPKRPVANSTGPARPGSPPRR
ncbi:MAG: hypothetical protein K2R93_05180 [Gemmatimonadaceae bacterium]|nr:hypothetical protein [Gemmatimonadaceae bacterium]